MQNQIYSKIYLNTKWSIKYEDKVVKWHSVHSVWHRVYMKCEADKVKVENVGDGKRLVALSLESLPDVGRCKHSRDHCLNVTVC